MSRNSKYITTAIVYPNSRIHIGWAWETLSADWLVRGYRGMGIPTRFATGMDEHSVKVQRAAEAQGLTPQAYCDRMADDIRGTLSKIGVEYDRFIRTSDEDHQRVVRELVKRAYDKGDIYKNRYEGHYCEGCEAFYLDKDLVDGLCPHHKTKPKWIAEENYFFKPAKYQKAIEDLFAKQPDFLRPDGRRPEVLNFVKEGLKDFSISRSTFDWGVKLPFDEGHVVYVWFDALINYLTAANIEPFLSGKESDFKQWWPASLHIIGKDITRFHCVYWPAMLMSLELPVPEHVFAHGWMNIRGDRMSKSSGNVVSPDDVLAVANADQLRYYLLAENEFGGDGNFALDLLALKVNADLANDFGNLVNRTINMTRKYFPGEALSAPKAQTHSKAGSEATRKVLESFSTLKGELRAALDAVDSKAYSQACTARSRVLNLYVDQTKPWALAKANTPESMAELREVLYTLMEGIRWVATALTPVIPFGMPEVFRQLAVPAPEPLGAIEKLVWGPNGICPGEPKPIYPRVELPKEE